MGCVDSKVLTKGDAGVDDAGFVCGLQGPKDTFFAVNSEGVLSHFDLDKKEKLKSSSKGTPFASLALSEDGNLLIGGGEGTISLVSAGTLEVQATLPELPGDKKPIEHIVALSTERILVVDSDQHWGLYDIVEQKLVNSGKTEKASKHVSVQKYRGNKIIWGFGEGEANLQIVDTKEMKVESEMTVEELSCFSVIPGSSRLFVQKKYDFVVYDLEEKKVVSTVELPSGAHYLGTPISNTKQFVCGPVSDGWIRVFEYGMNEPVKNYQSVWSDHEGKKNPLRAVFAHKNDTNVILLTKYTITIIDIKE